MRVTEGDVTVAVPEQPDAGVGDAVFFNPVQELNRDLTVAVLRALEAETDRDGDRTPRYLDANAASGVRGVRAAAEGFEATCCDVDPDAVELARENMARNDLDGRVVHRDANALMHEETFDVVDIDPFGTPIPFADAAFRGATRLVCITATDTAPLCGAHFESGVRHYSAVPRNTEYHAEMGMRVLISALVRTAARYDLAARPVFSHATKHYARTYLRLDSGARAANALVDELGHVDHCEHCLYREATPGLVADPLDWCPECDEAIQTAGPIWLGRTCDPAFAETVREAVDDGMGTAEQARELCETVAAELDEPTHYDQHRLCKRWGVGAVAMDEFIERLRAAGYSASRTHYGGTTFKTDAEVTEIRAAAVEED
ncbi:N(2),N(2)-dimethylguanosine tRNA methyltransferase [Halosimplex carlsbadense 2-9-1]|uniref:tRNA (guanine(26)-N(2))-dimethyltransferase n=1 Tax=Halosimplex carlsbadense 2-9-1 TaxID=797114 RepID=M0D159_9EURY|nr:tRNA (guanine(26)-N(2))-dimethyltransferase [Halosimplex carlsbadense]ELZ29246.1 N(2),N(2)-dimethylguanosine tRNA methyltransferase [Halosimplex carlsbadense 2-9-1]